VVHMNLPRPPQSPGLRESLEHKSNRLGFVPLCLSLAAFTFLFAQADEETFRKRREEMVGTQIASLRWSGSEAVRDARVLDAHRRAAGEEYTMEIVEPLGSAARERLAALGDKNGEVRIGDGYYGWPEKAPFDCIIVTAAANHIPPPLVEQLKPGGRMVIPVGNPFQTQTLVLVSKGRKGPRDIQVRSLMPVAFVPLVGGPKKNCRHD